MSDEPQVEAQTPTPVLTIRPLRAEITFIMSQEQDGVSTGLVPIKAVISQAEMNGISLGELARRAIEQAAKE